MLTFSARHMLCDVCFFEGRRLKERSPGFLGLEYFFRNEGGPVSCPQERSTNLLDQALDLDHVGVHLNKNRTTLSPHAAKFFGKVLKTSCKNSACRTS